MALSDLIDTPFYFAPVEDLLLPLLRPLEDEIPGLKVRSIIEDFTNFDVPYVMVRRTPGAFANDNFGDPNPFFQQRAVIQVETFTADPSGDEKGARLSEIVRARLNTVWRRNTIVPGVGHIAYLRMSSPPHRAADWATATGVVQYASLPKNLTRYETTYGIIVRPDEDQRYDPSALFLE